MKNTSFIYISILLLFLHSCASYEVKTTHKKSKANTHIYKTKNKEHKYTATSADIKAVLKEAEKYKGTPYKFGGTTYSGIDCSGLVNQSFNKVNKTLPRRSIDIANEGDRVSLSKIKQGDLLFFATGGGEINHVGIVYDIFNSGEIQFIHASTSKGVIISSLEESYWKKRFIKAKRVL